MSKSFDHTTHHYDSQGKVVRDTTYRLKIESGAREYERPPGSGVWYAEDGSVIRDDSAKIEAARKAAEEALAAAEAKDKADKDAAYRAAVKAELLAELEKEKGKSGRSNKS